MPERTRDDSVLSTGMSSAVERRRLAKQEELHNKRQRERDKITPDGTILLTWIDSELATVADLSKMTTEFNVDSLLKKYPIAQTLNVTSAELLQAQTIARLMHIEWLKSSKTKVKNLLKERKEPEADEPLEFGNE